ncbi:MAG: hypothetical protein ACXVOH_05925, partial [Bacteroidia bacterium]
EMDDLVVLSQDKVTLKINLDEYIQKKIQLPVEVSNLPPGMTIKTFPAFVEITVSAPYNLFDSLTVNAFKASADFNTADKSGGKLKLKIISSLGDIKITGTDPERVEYILRRK